MATKKAFSIRKLIEVTRQDGQDFRGFLENNMDKAVKEIQGIVEKEHAVKNRLLVRILNCHLVNHPELHGNLIKKLKEDPGLLWVLEGDGFQRSLSK